MGAVLFSYTCAVLLSGYRAGRFAYHDLTLISDFLASTAYRRGAFFITDYGISHLTLHFTPSLFMLVPLYRMFDSQFLLIALGAVAVAVSCAFQLALFNRILERTCPRDGLLRRWAPFAFLLLAAGNGFSKSVLLSAHYEVFYMPFASMTLWLLVRGSSAVPALVAVLFALGVRQDAGLYLFFQALSILFLPAGIVGNRGRLFRHVAAVCAVSAAYTALAVAVFMPLCGASANQQAARFWSEYGNGWRNVIFTMLMHPSRVAHDVARSGWPYLTLELGLLPLASHVSYLLSSIPGLLLFTADTDDKYLLYYYNSAWLLPGALVAAGMGLARVVRWTQTARPAIARALAIALVAVPIALACRTAHPGGGGPFWPDRDPHLPVPKLMSVILAYCPAVSSVATDFTAAVFIPNRLPKYLLRHFDRADAVFVDERAPMLLADATSMAEMRARVEASGNYRLTIDSQGVRAYLRSGVTCR